jgi:hypothetical protein
MKDITEDKKISLGEMVELTRWKKDIIVKSRRWQDSGHYHGK